MNYLKLLPIPKGGSFTTWVESWVQEISSDMTSIVKDSETIELRERNERLSSYLATMQTIMAAYKMKLDAETAVYTRQNPPNEKGIRAWQASLAVYLAEYQQPYDFIKSWYEAISKRLSVSQSSMRSRSGEASSIG